MSKDIENLIPHRAPFLFVDEILPWRILKRQNS